MALIANSKYQILLNPDSHKTQGLQQGDIVRRQYVDGVNIYYSLMAVLETGVESTANDAGEVKERPYFIGALLSEPDSAPKQGEMLDFVRITNLFNEDRNGALYLTASDSEAPYMDIIDQIGRKESLCWPENKQVEGLSDAFSQYIVAGDTNFALSYSHNPTGDYHRVLSVTRSQTQTEDFEGLTQQFYQFIKSPQCVLISYRIKASSDITMPASIGYTDDVRKDAEWTEEIGTEWEYKLRVVAIQYSGRHLRKFQLSFENLGVGETVEIADFNVILQSSVENFADASTMRIGKLDGIVDPVFGTLDGYGAYLQKLYATNGAHISGTLTAGDENGFGGTFYAGKIHRNCFVNSIDLNFQSAIIIADDVLTNPTGLGHIYSTDEAVSFVAQTREWLNKHLAQRYCFSLWIYAKWPCQIGVRQNGYQVGTIQVPVSSIFKWVRVHTYFDLLEPETDEADMLIDLTPVFDDTEFAEMENFSVDENDSETKVVYLTAPQLEKGQYVTQYQATDDTLNFTDDYGAWFARGGIGGTIQNPLIKLNYDGEGSVGSRDGSVEIKQDGSGHVAQGNISWDENGKVTFGTGVTLNWDNFSQEAQEELASRSVTITGEDTFTIVQDENSDDTSSSPASITLTLTETNLNSTSSTRQWYVKYRGTYTALDNANGLTLTVLPDGDYWDDSSSVTFKAEVTHTATGTVYSDEFTVRRQYVQGYEVRLASSNGQVFQNGKVNTVITANVYYRGVLVDLDEIKDYFTFAWSRFLNGSATQADELDGVVDPFNVLTLNHQIDSREVYRCDLVTLEGFDYTFPLAFDEDLGTMLTTEAGQYLITEDGNYIILE